MTAEDRLLEMENNERTARQAFMDKFHAATAPERKRLKDNLEEAEGKLTKAQKNGLKKMSNDLDNAVTELKAANMNAKNALGTVMQISDLLKKLEKATELAGKVLLAAV